ncbi:MAG: Gfo/Idh/MocA family oxidoreductase [Planctomycetales bacterium]|nr:Gfo/Idh/MocA family oxidoreductase [Planctomycetales bacterium]
MTEQLKKILVIGVGSIGERHVRCFQHTGRAEISICEINDSLRSEVAERYEIKEQFQSLDAALNVPHDAAVVAVPAHLHVPMSLQAAEQGLHLLIEKPLAVTTAGVETLIEAVVDRDLVAAVAYVYRASPALQAMKRAIDDGRFGKPVQLVAVSGQHFPTFRPAYRETYYRDRATGGGAIQDAITHVLNAGEWLVGPIDRLVADAAHLILEDVEVEDTVHLVARQGSVLSTYSLNQHQAPNEGTITVVCERGTVRMVFPEHRWRWMTDGEWQEPSQEAIERDTLFVCQANSFLDAIERKCEPLCTLDEGLQTLRVNQAALASVEHQQWTSITC